MFKKRLKTFYNFVSVDIEDMNLSDKAKITFTEEIISVDGRWHKPVLVPALVLDEIGIFPFKPSQKNCRIIPPDDAVCFDFCLD